MAITIGELIGQLLTRYLNHIGINLIFDVNEIFSPERYNIVNIQGKKNNYIFDNNDEYAMDFYIFLTFSNSRIPGLELQIGIDQIDNIYIYYTFENIDIEISFLEFIDFLNLLNPEFAEQTVNNIFYFLDYSVNHILNKPIINFNKLVLFDEDEYIFINSKYNINRLSKKLSKNENILISQNDLNHSEFIDVDTNTLRRITEVGIEFLIYD